MGNQMGRGGGPGRYASLSQDAFEWEEAQDECRALISPRPSLTHLNYPKVITTHLNQEE